MTIIVAEDHRIFLIVDITFDPQEACHLESWVARLSYDSIDPALMSRNPNDKTTRAATLWQQLQFNGDGRLVGADGRKAAFSPDLLPSMDRALAGLPGDARLRCNGSFSGAAPFTLRLDNSVQATYSLKLSQRGAERLISRPSGQRLIITFESATLYLPGSGCGMLVWQARVTNDAEDQNGAEVDAEWIVEALHQLSRAHSSAEWLAPTTIDTIDVPPDTQPGTLLYLRDGRPGRGSVWQARTEGSTYEALVLASRNQKRAKAMYWPCRPESDSPAPMSFSLLELSRQFLGIGSSCARQRSPYSSAPSALSVGSSVYFGNATQQRWYSYTQVLLRAGNDEASIESLAQRIAGHFTSDYGEYADPNENFQSLRVFGNIWHLLSSHGAATVLSNTDRQYAPQFLSDRGPRVYLPICLLAYHTYRHLLSLTEQSSFLPNDRNPKHDLDQIERLRSNLARYRLFFRFADVSTLQLPNAVHYAWLKAFRIADKERELEKDIEYGKLILEAAQEHRARWADRLLRIGMGLAGAAGVAVGIKHLVEGYIHTFVIQLERWQMLLYFNPDNLERKALTKLMLQTAERIHHYEQIGFLGGLFLAVAVFLLSLALGKWHAGGGSH